ncbi:MAG: hypothetical protein ABI409_01575 [Ramlibacter sp.]
MCASVGWKRRIDWAEVPAAKITLFYPGQTTYEWLRSKAHGGASKVARGGDRVGCHDEADAEQEKGAKLVKAGPLEPMPVAGKSGSVDLQVQAAYDEKNAYL